MPRTGTHATREVLRPHLTDKDWEQQVLHGKQLSPIAEIARIEHGHITVQELSCVLTQEAWAKYYKFAIVRNPFDRFVSVCSFLNRNNPDFKAHPLAWMKSALKRPRFQNRVLVRPQAHQLVDKNKEIGLDYIGRYENLQKSMNHVLSKLDLPLTPLKQRNASSHAHYKQYYDDELKNTVAAFYRQDLEMFSYDY